MLSLIKQTFIIIAYLLYLAIIMLVGLIEEILKFILNMLLLLNFWIIPMAITLGIIKMVL